MNVSQLDFPQLTISLTNPVSPRPQLLVTGGRAPSPQWLKTLRPHCGSLWAADHGIDACYAAALPPDHWIGDGDSASTAARQWMSELHIPVKPLPRDKDFTDTQIALTAMTADLNEGLIITGAFGGRFDHLYSTLFDCSARAVPCFLIDELEAVFYVKADAPLALTCHKRPKALSLIPFTRTCDGVTISNVRWTPKSTLQQAFPNAISNEVLDQQQPVCVSITSGILGIYLYWGQG